MTTIEAPRSPARPARKGVNWEKWGWIYMRLSGLVLIVLIFGHLLVNIVLGDGVKQIDFAFVAGKYATPFWQIWDLLMLWLAMIHGGNGMRTLVNDYAHNKTVNRILRWAILAAVVVMVVLGTLVIFT
ncbi:succinate dehydrogenase hydrophobic membrane anchor subunit, partial [Leifsonia sp. 71-9]